MKKSRTPIYATLILLLVLYLYTQVRGGILYATAPSPNIRPTSLELFEQAKSLEHEAQYREANQVYRSLSHLEPAYSRLALYSIARNDERRGEHNRAIRGYVKLLSSGKDSETRGFDTSTLILASLHRLYMLGAMHDSVERHLDRFSRFYDASSYYAVLLDLDRGDVKEAAHMALKLVEADEEPFVSLLLKRLTGDKAAIAYMNKKGIDTVTLLDMCMEKGLYDEALFFSYLLPDSDEVFVKRAFCFYRLRDYDSAVPLYLKYYASTGSHDALIKLAYCSFHQGKYDQAGKYLNQFMVRSHGTTEDVSSNREAALLQMQLDVQLNNRLSSLQRVTGFLQTQRGSRFSDIIATVAFYRALHNGYQSQALAYLRDIQHELHTEYYRGWAAYVIGIYGNDAALTAAMHLRPGSYYSLRAARLMGKPDAEVPAASVETSSFEPASGSVFHELCAAPVVEDIERMLQLGLQLADEEARPGYLFLLSKLAYNVGDPYRGISFAEKLLEALGSPPLLSLPREILELLYPQVFTGSITAVLEERKVDLDPALILAIIREESRYNQAARSSKGAMGLMQLMPDTASWILRNDTADLQLLEPTINITAGTAYLAYLYGRFDEMEYVIASYNGGPNNVGKWVRNRDGRSMEVFIEEIPYRETRNFVKRVYTSYRMYRFIYGDMYAHEN
jgi:soluble lytic murein transglycosylase